MRTKHLLGLGLALTIGGGLAPVATAAAATPAAAPAAATTASGGTDDLIARLGDVQRQTGVRQAVRPQAKSLAPSAGVIPSDPDAYYRLAGSNRYATAVEASKGLVCGPTETADQCQGLGGVDNPVTTVFVASGADFPDALGAGPLASGLGPLLLVPATGTVPTVVKNELARIQPTDIVIFGGTGAVSSGVASQLGAYGDISRIAGTNRYDTAADTALTNDEILTQGDADGDGTPNDGVGTQVVVLASGEGFADALSGGGAAANSWGSLMLTAKSTLPAPTKAALQSIKPPKVIILGGTGVVSAGVESAVKAAVPGSTVVRAAGSDRFGTANMLSQMTFPDGAPELVVVNGYNFPDALASAPAAGYWGASTLLTKATCVTSGTHAEGSRLNPQYVTGFGGTTVISDKALHLGVC